MFKAIAAMRLRWLQRRTDLVRFYMRQERQNHQEVMAQLRAELDALELRQRKVRL